MAYTHHYTNVVRNRLRVLAYAIERLQKQLLEIESSPSSSFRDKIANKLRVEIRKNERAAMHIQLKNVRDDLRLSQRYRQDEEYRYKIEIIREAMRNYFYLYINGLRTDEELKKIDPILIDNLNNHAETIKRLEKLLHRLMLKDKSIDFKEPLKQRLVEVADREGMIVPQVLTIHNSDEDANILQDTFKQLMKQRELLQQQKQDQEQGDTTDEPTHKPNTSTETETIT